MLYVKLVTVDRELERLGRKAAVRNRQEQARSCGTSRERGEEAIAPRARERFIRPSHTARQSSESLKGNRSGQHSIRVNDQFRICFIWRDGKAFDVEILDYH